MLRSASSTLSTSEWIIAFVASSVHGIQHVFSRVVPALIPLLAADLGIALWKLGMLVSVYMFAGGLFQAPMGVLADRVDKRLLLSPGIGLLSVGYLIFALAPAFGDSLPLVYLSSHAFTGPYVVMVCGMFVAGTGYSVIHPVGYPLISANVTDRNKGKVLGMWGSASKVGDMAAPLFVGALILVLTWQSVIVIVSAIGLGYSGGLFVYLSRSSYDTRPPTRAKPTDEKVHGITRWRSNPQAYLFPIATMLLFFFFSLFTVQGLTTYTPVYVNGMYGYSASIAGIEMHPESVANFYFAVMLVSGAVSQLVVGAVTDSYDHRLVLVFLLLVAAVALCTVSLVSLSPLLLLLVFVAIGSSIFGINPPRDALISEISPDQYEGRTFGYIWTIALTLASVYPVVIGYVIEEFGMRTSLLPLVLAALLAAGTIGFLYSPRIYQTESAASAN